MILKNSLSHGRYSFIKAISLLAGGTFLAHAVTTLAMPLLSRLYTPDDFGALAVFTGIANTVGVAACLRYDVAVALPESDDDGVALLLASLLSALFVGGAALLIVVFCFDLFSYWISATVRDHAKWLIPCAITGFGAMSAFQNWHIRKHNFKMLAQSRLAQSVVLVGIQGSIAWLGFGGWGLLLGSVISFFACIFFLGMRAYPEVRTSWNCLRLSELKRVVVEYRRFPIYSTWEAFFNLAAIHLPIILLSAETSTKEAGYLMMGMFVLQAPMGVLGSAIGQAFLSRAPQAFRDGRLAEFTDDVLFNLVKSGVGPIFAVGILSPVFFPIVFGSSWERAGWLVSWMIPWFVFQFLVSPISMVLHVVGGQRVAMKLQLMALSLRLGLTWLALKTVPEWIGEAYALSGGLVYAAYLGVVRSHIKPGNFISIKKYFVISVKWIVPWVVAALMLSTCMNYILEKW